MSSECKTLLACFLEELQSLPYIYSLIASIRTDRRSRLSSTPSLFLLFLPELLGSLIALGTQLTCIIHDKGEQEQGKSERQVAGQRRRTTAEVVLG
jgi:hypothetical protein